MKELVIFYFVFHCFYLFASEEIDNKVLKSGLKIYKKANCANCHSWHGNGGKGGYGIGVSLRNANNSLDQLANIIKCGIPGTQMPFYFKNSYNNTQCYGMLFNDFSEKEKPNNIGKFLNKKEIFILSQFIFNELQGRQLNKNYCINYFSKNSRICENL